MAERRVLLDDDAAATREPITPAPPGPRPARAIGVIERPPTPPDRDPFILCGSDVEEPTYDPAPPPAIRVVDEADLRTPPVGLFGVPLSRGWAATGSGVRPEPPGAVPRGPVTLPQSPVETAMFPGARDAGRVVFVCDATGTMVNHLAALKRDLNRAVDGLRRGQPFNLLFFYDGPKVRGLQPDVLLPANAATRRIAAAFLDGVDSSGTTDPIPALQLALRLQPQTIYFVTDGELGSLRSWDEVRDAIRALDRDNAVRIHTVLFDGYYDYDAQHLTAIAAESGGTYRYVREVDVPR